MGGRPFLALNIAAFPPDLPSELVSEIIRGGAEKALEAGVVIAGGHTIQDKEPKFGLVVVGMVDPQRMLTKGGLRPGDRLVLTKPLGFGVTTTALKRQVASKQDVEEAVQWMTRLNAGASQLAVEFKARSGTDVTGYSLLGHALEMAHASQVRLRFDYDAIPFISGARRYAEQWTFPGGAADNRLYFQPHIQFAGRLDEASQMLLFDPQTSGGLLFAVESSQVAALEERARQTGQAAWIVGEVLEGSDIEVV
jgi:selenide,water dikinase